MEEKKTYPEAKVTITAEEYKDLITEAINKHRDADYERDRRWKAESEMTKFKVDLLVANGRISELEIENKKLINEMAKLEVELANYKEVCKNVCS